MVVLMLVSGLSLSMRPTNMNANALPPEFKDDVCNNASNAFDFLLCGRSGRDPYWCSPEYSNCEGEGGGYARPPCGLGYWWSSEEDACVPKGCDPGYERFQYKCVPKCKPPQQRNAIGNCEHNNCPSTNVDIKDPELLPYTVSGSDLSKVYDDIVRQRGRLPNGNPDYGELSAKPIPKEPKLTTEEGKVKEICVTIKAEKVMPSFPDVTKLSINAQKEWERFFGKLDQHENNHLDIVRQYMSVSNLDFRMKDKTPNEALKVYRDIVWPELDGATKKYDKDTNHGGTEGVHLNRKILAEPQCKELLGNTETREFDNQSICGETSLEDRTDSNSTSTGTDNIPPIAPKNATAAPVRAGETVRLQEVCIDGVDNYGDGLVDADDTEECPPFTILPNNTTTTPEPPILEEPLPTTESP